VGACRFDPVVLRCSGAKTAGCLSAWQVDVLKRTFAGPQNSQGRPLYVGQLWDPGISTPGWRQWKLGTSTTAAPNAMNTTLMAGALGYEFFTPPAPGFSLLEFDFDRDPPRMEAFSREYDTYRDAMLNAFKNRGGKLLMIHGAADPIFSALESMDYFTRLAENNGGATETAKWARLFLVPGMNHCSGGAATDSFDGLSAIVDWVEKDMAPARITATALPNSTFFPNRTRPLCPYPSYAKYDGRGPVESEASFVCAQP
jgi:feruloyl esterase